MKKLATLLICLGAILTGCTAEESAPNETSDYASPENTSSADDAAIQEKLDMTQKSNSRSATGK